MSELLSGDLLASLALDHQGIRTLLARLEVDYATRCDTADELDMAVARHRAGCTETVVHCAARTSHDHEQQVRLLIAASRGMHQIVDRLRLPAPDERVSDNLVEGLRVLLFEHERLELELTLTLVGFEAEPLSTGSLY